MASWFGRKRGGVGKKEAVMDGSKIKELVENREAFSTFVDHKFEELDHDHDGRLSVRELQPAVADIGAALGLPAPGASEESDHIYSEVLNEFTHGKQKDVSKSEFQEVLSDILLGMAAGLKRDPIVILRIDGEDLKAFVESPRFESETVSIFSSMESANASLSKSLTSGLEHLTVEHGMPPPSDSWVSSNIIDPALQSLSIHNLGQPTTQEMFMNYFKKFLENIIQRLEDHPVIVAHSENTFEGSGIKRLMSNKFELDKLLDSAWRDIPNDRHHKASKQYLRVALDGMAASAGLPPYGSVPQFDAVVDEVFKKVNADDGKLVHEEEFKKTLVEILAMIMLQLEGTPIFVSSNSVVHEPMSAATSSILASHDAACNVSEPMSG